ncbi:MAG: GntR family transcriptional regulator [Terriglobia bacterium]|nr:MAG: GntR family transcriptional regulator [Terriglobia bacterium]
MPSEIVLPKHERVRQTLADAIASGQYEPGDRLPSESELVKSFGASRPTVNRALRELQLAGVIERRAGSGSYVRMDAAARGYTFGLLIPELGRTEIFEPICRGMVEAQHGSYHVLLWASSLGDEAKLEQQAAQACRQLVAKKVSGIFFAPLELTAQKDTINRSIAEIFDRAGVPLVLLDRDLVPYPERSAYDLVGIDNRRAGYTITSHLIRCGCRRVVFLGRPGSAPTVDARIAGYSEALAADNLEPHASRIEPDDQAKVKETLSRLRPDGFVCANDFTAAKLLKTLNDLGVSVPDQIRMAGIDDVKYASLLSVPLTTIHQPCPEMGAIAISTMMERLRHPNLPARDILLNFHMVIRDSCGARKKGLTVES